MDSSLNFPRFCATDSVVECVSGVGLGSSSFVHGAVVLVVIYPCLPHAIGPVMWVNGCPCPTSLRQFAPGKHNNRTSHSLFEERWSIKRDVQCMFPACRARAKRPPYGTFWTDLKTGKAQPYHIKLGWYGSIACKRIQRVTCIKKWRHNARCLRRSKVCVRLPAK